MYVHTQEVLTNSIVSFKFLMQTIKIVQNIL